MTTAAARPPAWDTLVTALRQRRPVRLSYHGRQRTVCPHALGWKNDRALLLGYQTGGQTSAGSLPANPRSRWRNFFIDEIDHADLADTPWQSAENYNAAHPFNAIDRLSIAVGPDNPSASVR